MEDRTKLMVEKVYGVPSGLDESTKRTVEEEEWQFGAVGTRGKEVNKLIWKFISKNTWERIPQEYRDALIKGAEIGYQSGSTFADGTPNPVQTKDLAPLLNLSPAVLKYKGVRALLSRGMGIHPGLIDTAALGTSVVRTSANLAGVKLTPKTFGFSQTTTPGPFRPPTIKGKSPYADGAINVDAYSPQPIKANIPKYAKNAKIPMPELAKQQRVEHAFQFSMKDTYGLPDVTTDAGKSATKLDSIKYHFDNRNLLDNSQKLKLNNILATMQSKDRRSYNSIVGTTTDKSVTEGQRAYGKMTETPGPRTPHHGGGLDQTATPQARLGQKGVLMRNQLNIDYGIPTGDDPLNYYGVYDVATRGHRQAKLDSLAPLYDKITKNKPRNIKQFTGITLNDAFGSSDIAFGKPGGKVTPKSYPIIRGINNEDILRTQNNIKPGSPITTRIWNNRWNHIADYYGISKNVFRKFNRNPEISPDDITVSADHITIHDLIDAGKELKGTALHEVERLGGNVQDLTKPQAWEKLDTYKASAILGESIAESHAIALGVLMRKVEIIKQDPVLRNLWNMTDVDDIPMLMDQLKTEFAGKGWFEFISKNKSKWVESILEGDLLKNYDPTDLKKIQTGFKLKVPKKLWQKDFRTTLREVWNPQSSKMSEADAIRTDLDIDAFRSKTKMK